MCAKFTYLVSLFLVLSLCSASLSQGVTIGAGTDISAGSLDNPPARLNVDKGYSAVLPGGRYEVSEFVFKANPGVVSGAGFIRPFLVKETSSSPLTYETVWVGPRVTVTIDGVDKADFASGSETFTLSQDTEVFGGVYQDGVAAKVYLIGNEGKTAHDNSAPVEPTEAGQPVGDFSNPDLARAYAFGITVVVGAPLASASNPSPANEATDVPRDVVLTWSPGVFADKHDVYFGTSLDDVNNATATVDLTGVYWGRQSASTYAIPERPDLGQTYYWRVDEVNAPPDLTVFKGNVWQFTVEPVAYPIPGTSIIAGASSLNRTEEGPENTVNGSGLNGDDLHSFENAAMWLSSGVDPNAAWIQYEFDGVYKLYQMLVWNYNSSVEPLVGFGIKEATIEYATDGTNWTTLGTTHEFARGPGATGYASNTTVDFAGAAARYVKITAQSNWGGIFAQYGLSEVRFFYIPVLAREPDPPPGATDVSVDATLSWKPGREASAHNVYLSNDEQAVIDGTVPPASVTSPSYASSLNLASTYYWRIDEVNDAEVPSSWQGDIWSLSTQEYLVVDDFEAYNDIESGQEGSNLVYETWTDGFGTTTNGSTIGYAEAFQPSMEKTRIYDGKQAVPFFYNNTTASVSEVTANVANLKAGRDWSKHGIKGLTLRFYGDPNNVPQQMYVKINSAKVRYEGNAENLNRPAWQMWYVDLASLGTNLSNVTTLTIGFERIGGVGGQGMLLLDGIRLYSYDRELITPIDPGTASLQAQYQFEGNANDSSGKGRNGTAMGEPAFVAGKVGQAISLDGLNDYVTIAGYKGILADTTGIQQPCTVSAWVKTTDSGDRTIASWGTNSNMLRVDFRLYQGRLRVEHGGGNAQGDATLNDDNWHHVALTIIRGATISYPDVQLWLDGKDDTRPSTSSSAFSITADVDMAIGYRATAAGRYFFGAIDDVSLYDRALSAEEIAWLAGLTKPFDKPF